MMGRIVPFETPRQRRVRRPSRTPRFPARRLPRHLRRSLGFALFLAALVLFAIFDDETSPETANAAPYPPAAPVLGETISVYDGDTIRLGDERIRIVGLDTPELGHRAQCQEEAVAAEQAKQALAGEIASGNVELHRQGTDRYGRTLARVTVDGRDVADTLIAQGLARPYGGGRREGWCS